MNLSRQGMLRVTGAIEHAIDSPSWSVELDEESGKASVQGWQSNGGDHGGHPLRANPYTLQIPVPEAPGRLVEVELKGIFAIHADCEPLGTQGASLFLGDKHRFDLNVSLYNGRHYADARVLDGPDRMAGDGTVVRKIGVARQNEQILRVDKLQLDVSSVQSPRMLMFHDLNTPASFVLLGLEFAFELAKGCPFHAKGGGIPLRDLGSIIRVGDRVRLHAALAQLERAVLATDDLDEARGEALTFIAIVTAATLEMGGSRTMHRVQLEAARRLDALSDRAALAREARRIVEDTASLLLPTDEGPNDPIIDRALNLIDRNFAKDLSDMDIAGELGLSTSHFRYLFRKATGLPFHKYLIGLRLERARQMLLQEDLPVSEIAEAVGFSGLPHFSRAFSQRFSVNPSTLRRAKH